MRRIPPAMSRTLQKRIPTHIILGFLAWFMLSIPLVCAALLTWLFVGCALIEQRTGEGISHSGYIKAGIWPRHNESILNHYSDISEGLLEIKETVSYNRFNVILNPRFLAGGSWPAADRTETGQVYWRHHGQWIYADLFYTLEYRLNYRKAKGNWYVGYEKERAYELWHDQTGKECNCTYSNLFYLKYSWER